MKKNVVIDLFAGGGGFSLGAIQAGAKVAWAGNHWTTAVEFHSKNHPGTQHVCQDLHQADWSQVPSHRITLASPACQGHSRSRGKDRPHHDVTRSTAWAVVSCVEYHRPEHAIVENVPDFLKWKLFPAWKMVMEQLGYTITVNVLNAQDFGVPQHRERLFIVATRGKKGITIESPMLPHIPASDIIDWKGGDWQPINRGGKRPRAANTLEQIANGRKVHGDRFLVAYYGSETNGRSIHKPVGTITTVDRFAVVKGNEMRMLSKDELRKAMGFPEDYILPERHKDFVKLLGNAVPPPMAKEVVAQVMAA